MIRSLVNGSIKREDIFGRKIQKKMIQREIMEENRINGRMGEESVKLKLKLAGYNVKRSPRGRDFIATKENFITGKCETIHVEVKTGNNSRLSKLQKKEKKRLGNNYVVARERKSFY